MRLNLCFAFVVLCVSLIEAGPAPKIEENKTLQETEKLEKTDLKIEESNEEKERAKKSTATFCVNLKPGSTDPNQISCKNQQAIPSVEVSPSNLRKTRAPNGQSSSSSSSDEKNVASEPTPQLSSAGGLNVPVSLPISHKHSGQLVAQPVLQPGLPIIPQHGELRSALDDVDFSYVTRNSFEPILPGGYPPIPLQSPYYPYAIAAQPRMVLPEMKHAHHHTSIIEIPDWHQHHHNHHSCAHNGNEFENFSYHQKPCADVSDPFAERDSSAESLLRTHHIHHHAHIIEKPSSCCHHPSVVYHCEPHTVLRDADAEPEPAPEPSPKTSNTIVNWNTPVVAHHGHPKPYIHGVDVGYPYVYRPHPHSYIPAGLSINAYHPHAHVLPFRSTIMPTGQLTPEFFHKRTKNFATGPTDGSSTSKSAKSENSEQVAAKKDK